MTQAQIAQRTEPLDVSGLEGHPNQFERTVGRQPQDKWFDTDTTGSDYSPTLRAAIDGAMAAGEDS